MPSLRWAGDHILRIENGNIHAQMKGTEPFRSALCCARHVALLDDRLPGVPILDGLPSKAKPSHIIVLVAQELVLVFIVGRDVRKVDFVSQDTADSTKALDELCAFLRLVRDKFEVGTKLGILLGEPLQQALWLTNLVHLNAGRLVKEPVAFLLLLFVGIDNDFLCHVINI